MEICTAKILQSTLEDAEIIISTPFPEIDRDFYSPFRVVKCSRRRLIWASFQLLRAFIWGLGQKFFGWNLKFLIPEEELQTYVESDLVLDLSGDMLTEDYGPHITYSHFIPILMSLFLRRPVFLCAQSIGPFKLTKYPAKYILDKVDHITVRDEITLRYLEEIGVKKDTMMVTADMAFSLIPASRKEVNAILQHEQIPAGEENILGVSLSRLVESKYIKLNPISKQIGFADLMAGTLDRICSELNLQVVLVPHVTGPSVVKDDRNILREVRDRMKEKAHLIEGDYGPEELKGIIGRSAVFLGARMHANISALSSAVPVAAISYSHKTPGIMQMFGQKDFVCSIETLTGNEIYEKVKAIHTQRDNLSAGLRETILDIQSRVAKNIELVVQFLEPTRSGSCSR